jgi:hypothetical protein
MNFFSVGNHSLAYPLEPVWIYHMSRAQGDQPSGDKVRSGVSFIEQGKRITGVA